MSVTEGLSFLRLKEIFTHSTFRTCPVIGKVIKRSSGLDTIVRITYCRVIHPATDSTNIFFIHSS